MADQIEDSAELTSGEHRVLDELPAMAPPDGFADRVLAARVAPVSTRRRWPIVAIGLGIAVAASVAIVIARGGPRSGHGELATTERTTLALADRGVAVAEAQTQLTWRVDSSGAAEIDQRAGNVFYRVEHGGPFVIHTPEGDVRVTGTCLRIEVSPMNPTKQMFVSGAVGAAIASAVIVTVYEGHVLAESHGNRTELAAGSRATLGQAIAIDTPSGSIGDSVAAKLQQDQIARLHARIGELERQLGKSPNHTTDHDDGRPWFDPSHDTLLEWAANCHIRYDDPGVDQFTPLTADDETKRGIEPSELDDYNAALGDVAKQWHDLVRSLYLEATGDAAGADTLSVEAMRNEIEQKSPRGEQAQLLQKLARERAGLVAPPGDPSKLSPLEQLMRAVLTIGDQSEAAIAKRLGADRAAAIRGDGWGGRHEHSGCPKP